MRVAQCSTPEEIAAAVALTCAAFPHERAGLSESQWAELETSKLLARPGSWGHIGVAKLHGVVVGVIFLKSAHVEGGTSFTEVSRRYGCMQGFWRWAYDNFVLEDELEDNELLVEYIAVSPTARGKGVGQALMAWAERQGSVLLTQPPSTSMKLPVSVPMISLWVASDNQAACALYKRCGYCIVRRTSASCCPALMATALQHCLGHPVWQKMVKTLAVPGWPCHATVLEPPIPTLMDSLAPLATLRRLSSATFTATATLIRSASSKFAAPTDGLTDSTAGGQMLRQLSGWKGALQPQEQPSMGMVQPAQEQQLLQQSVAASTGLAATSAYCAQPNAMALNSGDMLADQALHTAYSKEHEQQQQTRQQQQEAWVSTVPSMSVQLAAGCNDCRLVDSQQLSDVGCSRGVMVHISVASRRAAVDGKHEQKS